MQTAQTIIKNYRRKRVIVCVTVALLTLILTLGIRFVSQRNVNQQRILDFTSHTVRALDNVLLSLENHRNVLQPLVGQPCLQVQLALRQQAAILQTVRSIALIEDGILYCSSIFGSRSEPVRDVLQELPASTAKLILSTDQWLLKGSPVLIQWYPVSQDGEDGVVEIINIDLIARMILEPQRPLINDVVLTVGNRFLRYGQRVTDSLTFDEESALFQQSSTQNPFTITVGGPGPGELALKSLPAQLPLVLFAIITFFFWLLTHRGRFGRHLFLLGQNPRAARYAALSVNGIPYVLYGLVGVASAVAALVMVSYFGSARSDLGRDLLMPALTAAVLGGANIYGGSGSILGTALAALLVGYLQQGLQMVGIPNQVSSALSGALLVVVVMGRSLSLHREWVRATWRRLFSHKTIGA